MKRVIINEKATINATGEKNGKACKPVICIDDGRVYTSVTDAAVANNVGADSISNCCNGKQRTANGKRFCFVSRVSTRLEDLIAIIEKAAAYDAIKAEENAAKEAREKYEADLAKATAKYERCQETYIKATDKMIAAQERLIEAEEELNAIKEMGKQFEA